MNVEEEWVVAQPRFMLMRMCRLERSAHQLTQGERSVQGARRRSRVGSAAGSAGTEGGPTLDPECNFGWRLLSSNNRELGRGAIMYRTEQECRTALARGQVEFLHSAPLITPGADGNWTWRYPIDGVPFAVAARGYQRQRECRYSLALFVLALPNADFADQHPCGSGPACPTWIRPPASTRIPPLMSVPSVVLS